MAWFSRSVSEFFQGKEEQHEGWDEMEDAESEEEQDEEQGSVSTGKGVKEDLSELTKSFTRQLWGVASFMAPPPPSPPLPPSSPPPATSTSDENASLDKENFHPVEEHEGISALELEPVALTPSPSAKARFHFQSEEEIDSSSWDAGIPDSSILRERQSKMEQQIMGVRSDLAELKGGFAKGLSHLSSVIRVVAGDDLLLPASIKTEARSPKIQTTDRPSAIAGFSSILRPLLANIGLDKVTAPEANTTGKDDADEDSFTPPADFTSSPQEKQNFTFPLKLVSHIDEFSKMASGLLPFDSDSEEEDPEDSLQAAGVIDEVVAFADSITMHPETWLDFPLFSEEEEADDFEMNSVQQMHVQGIEYASRRLAALKIELCPQYMRDGRFWKIYFVLLHSFLQQENNNLLLSTPQVLEVRNLLLQGLQKRESRPSVITSVSEEEDGVKNDDPSYNQIQLENRLNEKGNVVESSDDFSTQKVVDLLQLGALHTVKDDIEVGATGLNAAQVGSSSPKGYATTSEKAPEEKEDKLVALIKSRSEEQVNDLQEEEDLKNDKGMGPNSHSVQKNALVNEEQALTVKPESLDVLRFPSLADDDEAEADEWLEEEPSSPGITLDRIRALGSNGDEDISFSDLEDEDDKSMTCTMPKVAAATTSKVKKPQACLHLNKNLSQEELKESQDLILSGKGDRVPEKTESNEWLTVDEEDIASTGSS